MKASDFEEVYDLIGKDGGECIYAPRVEWVEGSTTVREIREGFHVHWALEKFDREVRVRDMGGEGFVIVTYALEGMWRDVAGARRRIIDRPAGTMAIIRGSQLVEHRALQTQSAMHLTMAIETTCLLKWLDAHEPEDHPRLRRFLRGEGNGILVLPLTLRARQLVLQMKSCPFHGLTRSLAMEARCIDLLVDVLAELERPDEQRKGGRSRMLAKSEVDRIHAAAAHLGETLNCPPTLALLAKRFHLSESKLKVGFHQVFGTTAFGYLRQLRMKEARYLLENGGSTVLEVSHKIGVSNPSHFANMFKEHFGMNPKQFQMNAIRQK